MRKLAMFRRGLSDAGLGCPPGMDGTRWEGRSRWLVLLALLAAVPSYAFAQQRTRNFPSDEHYRAFRPFQDGDFMSAGREFSAVPRLKSVEGIWIDSIPYHAMIGECMYQMGDLTGALQQYTTALQVSLQYPDWLLRINVPDTLKPSSRTPRHPPSWGATSRAVRVASIPNHMGIRMGNTDAENARVVQQGGVVSAPYISLVDAGEIVRCTVLAIRRRAEILGPASEYDTLTNDLVTALSRRPAPPNNWSQAWISAELGLAYAAKGKDTEAVAELQKSLLVAGMDHGLTSTSLLELGKMAYRAGDYATAGTYFFEATFSAALLAEDDFTQYQVLAEAFRWGMVVHLITGKGTFSPPLGMAVDWSKNGPRILEASILLSAAENLAAINDTSRAQAHLDRVTQVMRRRECSNGELGARFQFVSAQTSFQKGDAKHGAKALVDALAYQRKGSLRLFQIGMVDGLFASGAVTTRQAGLLFAQVLRDPTPQDWATDPLETLSVLTIPHVLPYEHWMLLALDRKENDNALRISEAIRRHHFYCSLPLGGRLVNLRWTLEAPAELLPQPILLQRQGLFTRYPAYAELSQRVSTLRGELAALPGNAEDPETQKKVADLQTQLSDASEAMERMLEVMALSREPSETLFPPPTDVTLVQQQLTPGQRVLVFNSTRNATFAFLLGSDKYSMWKLESPAKIKTSVAKLLREMGQFDRNQPIGLKDLTSNDWKETAVSILKELTADAPAEAWNGFEELIIVPDGMLWYVPFEALQISDGTGSVSLIDKMRVRYAPTISLAVPDKRPRPRVTRTAVVAGSLFPRDSDAIAQEFLEELKADDANTFGVSVKPPPPSAVLAKTVDRLVVLNDLDNDLKGPYDWAPMTIDRGKSSGSLAQWIRSPWGGPDQIVLPGFHTPAENGLKRGGSGDDVFLSVCGLMATGSRTVLVSRWRDGGRTSYDLVREFVRELPHRAASDAWQRSVRLAVAADLDMQREPRVKEVPPDAPPMKAEHPFFWGAYMLIDTGVVPK